MQTLYSTRYKNYIRLLTTLLTKRQDVRLYLDLLLSLVAIAFFSFFAIRPTVLTILDLRKGIESKKQTLSQLEQKAKNLNRAQQELGQIEHDLPAINQAIPDTAQPHVWIRQLELLASQEGIAVNSISVGKIQLIGRDDIEQKAALQLPKNLQSFTVSFVVEGEPTKVISFLRKISAMRQPLVWDTASIVGKPAGSATSLTLSVNGYITFLKKQ